MGASRFKIIPLKDLSHTKVAFLISRFLENNKGIEMLVRNEPKVTTSGSKSWMHGVVKFTDSSFSRIIMEENRLLEGRPVLRAVGFVKGEYNFVCRGGSSLHEHLKVLQDYPNTKYFGSVIVFQIFPALPDHQSSPSSVQFESRVTPRLTLIKCGNPRITPPAGGITPTVVK